MKASFRASAVMIGAALTTLALCAPASADGEKTKLPPVLTSFWAFPKDPAAITLVVAGATEPVSVGVSGDTGVGGVCLHCTLNQPFKVKETSKTCSMCGCGTSNAVCVAWKKLRKSSWEEMITNFPVGLALRVAYNTPDKPESGLKTLWIDRRTFFAQVEGLDGKSPAELASIVKVVGGGKAEMVDGGKRLMMNLKQDYDTDQEAKLLKALEKIGAKIIRPAEVAATQ